MSAETLKAMGVDVELLATLPIGGQGREWEPAWRTAIQSLYVGGLSPIQICEEIPNGPSRETIYKWATAGNWGLQRDAFQRKVVEKSLSQVEESLAQINQRHIKALKAAQMSALSAIAQRQVAAKSLEGTISALVQAVNAERKVRGIDTGPEVEVNNTQFNLTSLGVDLDVIDRLPPDQRDAALELQRQHIEIQAKLNALSAGGPIIEGQTNEQNHPVESGGNSFDAPLP